jgi:hypothetical protein
MFTIFDDLNFDNLPEQTDEAFIAFEKQIRAIYEEQAESDRKSNSDINDNYVGHFTPERTYAMAIQAFDESIVKYIALRLAILFENYAIASTDKFCNHQLANTSDQHAGEYIKKIPTPPPLMLEKKYKLIDLKLLNDILDFPQKCVLANDNALFPIQIDGDKESTLIVLEENTINMAYREAQIFAGVALSCFRTWKTIKV